jgi:FKBP-type peptidyl-prolyl cis-trans isomerase FklB
MLAAAAHNKTAAQEFLASNGKKSSVKTTASGLEYKVEKAGDAKAPAITPEDEVTVNYRGKLLDGSEFDSSDSHGKPLEIPVGGVIKGWQEALVQMKPGAKWTLYVPPELAYGANPRPGIPGNSLLVFDIEVLSVKPKQAAPVPMPQKPSTMMPNAAVNQRVRSRAFVRSPMGGSPCSMSARLRRSIPGTVSRPNRRIISRMMEPVSYGV